MTSIVKTRDQISRRALFVGAGALSFAAANAGPIAVANAGDAPTKVTSPDAAHAAGAESWLSGLALQAATYAAPIVAMYNLRDTTSVGSSAKAPPNEIWRVSDIADPQVAEQLGYVTPNVNVIYGFGFMDLAREPIVLKAPQFAGPLLHDPNLRHVDQLLRIRRRPGDRVRGRRLRAGRAGVARRIA